MNNKFLKPTLHFGLGISLLMTLVACPAESDSSEGSGNSDESDTSHLTEAYDLLFYNYSARQRTDYCFLYRIINPLYFRYPHTLRNIFFPVLCQDPITIKGPIRLIEDTVKNFNVNLNGETDFRQRISSYTFDKKGLLTKHYYAGGHRIWSYDEYDNIIQEASFNSLGKIQAESRFNYIYDAFDKILTLDYTGVNYHNQVDSVTEMLSESYSYKEVENYPNGTAKVIHSFVDGRLTRIIKLDDKGNVLQDSLLQFNFWETVLYSYASEVESVHYNFKGTFRETYLHLNNKGDLIKELVYDNDTLVDEISYNYDSSGRIVKTSHLYFSSNKNITTEISELDYDNKGNIKHLKTSYNNESEPYSYNLLTFQNYDDYGNPKVVSYYSNGVLKNSVERKIYYYE